MDDLQKQLRTSGGAQAHVATDADADEWRKAARTAARQLGRPVETIQHGHTVLASLRDWPANELEQQVTDARMRTVMERMSISALTSKER